MCLEEEAGVELAKEGVAFVERLGEWGSVRLLERGNPEKMPQQAWG